MQTGLLGMYDNKCPANKASRSEKACVRWLNISVVLEDLLTCPSVLLLEAQTFWGETLVCRLD